MLLWWVNISCSSYLFPLAHFCSLVMAQLTHVRLEDCFGEEHVVDIRNLPDGVQQSVQKQIEETYGIKQLPFERRKEPDGTIGLPLYSS